MDTVYELHNGRNGGIEMKSLVNVGGNLADCLVHQTAKSSRFIRKSRCVNGYRGVDKAEAFVNQFP